MNNKVEKVVIEGITFYPRAARSLKRDKFIAAHIGLIEFAPKINPGEKVASESAIKTATSRLENIYSQL